MFCWENFRKKKIWFICAPFFLCLLCKILPTNIANKGVQRSQTTCLSFLFSFCHSVPIFFVFCTFFSTSKLPLSRAFIFHISTTNGNEKKWSDLFEFCWFPLKLSVVLLKEMMHKLDEDSYFVVWIVCECVKHELVDKRLAIANFF